MRRLSPTLFRLLLGNGVHRYCVRPRGAVVMFSDDFFGDLSQQQDNDGTKETPKRPKSPPRSCEDWLSTEGITQWPCSTRGDVEESPKPDDILGSLDDIRTDLMTHSRELNWNPVPQFFITDVLKITLLFNSLGHRISWRYWREITNTWNHSVCACWPIHQRSFSPWECGWGHSNYQRHE